MKHYLYAIINIAIFRNLHRFSANVRNVMCLAGICMERLYLIMYTHCINTDNNNISSNYTIIRTYIICIAMYFIPSYIKSLIYL